MTLVLMYHRIAVSQNDPWGLCVSAERFAQHLTILRSQALIVPLSDLAAGRVPSTRRTVALTFDDGYADNLHAAKPVLERFESPATVFVATAPLDQAREFWWDELERILLQNRSLPPSLKLDIGGQTSRWELDRATDLPADEWRTGHTWRAWEQSSTPRQALYLDLWNRIRPLPHDEQQSVLTRLADWAAVDRLPRSSHRTLSPSELVALAGDGLVEIGAHTVTHPLLPSLPPPVQRTEIARSKEVLETIVGRDVSSFAYPFGAHDDGTVSLVRECGFSVACASTPDRAPGDVGLLRLPRVGVQDWTREEFSARLAGWW
jgi:peptidoglycan/xylan/chitin deacetylase (PgdA/CDA1 family)